MFLKLICLVFYLVSPLESANILAIAPCPSYSHQIAYTHLWKRLSLRGHKVTLITTDPLNDPTLTNLTEIDVKFTYTIFANISTENKQEVTMWTFHEMGSQVLKIAAEAQLAHPDVQDLIQNPKSFDVIFVEFLTPEFLAFSEIYKCPKILFASMEVTASFYHVIGNPAHPVLHPEFVSPFHGQLSFQERVTSILVSLYHKYLFTFKIFPLRQRIMNKYFNTTSTVTGLLNDLDLMILTVSPLIQGPRPLGPNIISIAGYREDVSLQPLSSVSCS